MSPCKPRTKHCGVWACAEIDEGSAAFRYTRELHPIPYTQRNVQRPPSAFLSISDPNDRESPDSSLAPAGSGLDRSSRSLGLRVHLTTDVVIEKCDSRQFKFDPSGPASTLATTPWWRRFNLASRFLLGLISAFTALAPHHLHHLINFSHAGQLHHRGGLGPGREREQRTSRSLRHESGFAGQAQNLSVRRPPNRQC